ncbi:glycosyltransferase family 9 protein [Gryllotalpicola ginsengisoli]|uniref:glycosyltransferase family 9 protein n=1 Tax=Gryllotalpicola ginsengisoli TaxID=444608 RepID=UPI0003B49D12|nr:glycosyltransferase family 9 protein [Gryllotalpicola ginsengisoli]
MRILPAFPDVRRIAVLRGGGLGDVLFAVPALFALHAAYPEAEITVLSGPSGDVLADRLPFPVRLERLPHTPGVYDGEGPEPAEEFFARWQAMPPDLAVQLHGGGRNSNPFLLRLGARHTVGTATPDAARLERTVPYEYYQHEMLRGLEVAGLAGAAPVVLEPELAATAGDRAAASSSVAGPVTVAVHPGATDARRRWPAEKFGAVARALAEQGAEVVVVGDASERGLADEVVRAAASDRVRSLAGELDLSALCGVLDAAPLLVGNDSGPRHLAHALGTPTVSVYWCGNVINAGPLSRAEHRLHVSWQTTCPVCGRDQSHVGWTSPRCEHDVSFVAEVEVDDVLADARELLGHAAAAPVN